MSMSTAARFGAMAALALSSAVVADVLVYEFPIDAAQEVPANGSPATGTGTVTLDTDTLQVTWNIVHTVASPTASHFHGPAMPGAIAGVQVNLGSPVSPIMGAAVITAVQAADLQAGLWYVNIHSTAFPGGEIRGQVVAAQGPSVRINEVRIDQGGTDNDEYFELAGDAGASLDGLTYLVIGDGAGGSGTIEAVVSLAGQALDANGLFVAAESTFTIGTANLVANLNFENSDNVTHVLVSDFTGMDGMDLDTNDDGVLDLAPWSGVVDAVGMIEEANPPVGTEYSYGAALGFEDVGPDGTFVPGHIYRCGSEGVWTIGQFEIVGGDDTPNAANPDCPAPGACCIEDGSCVDVFADECTALGGTFQGDGTSCMDADCPLPCPADLDASGEVGFDDLLQLLGAWGPCAGCPADFDGTGEVDFNDLLTLLAAWGPCP